MFYLSRLGRAPLRRVALSLCALAAVVGVAAPAAQAAPGDPDLRVSAPSSTATDWFDYFDDHSTVGDNHNGWVYADGSGDPKWTAGTEPFAIRFQSSVQAAGAGLRVCGYKATADGNIAQQWMRAYQVPSSAPCPASAPASGQMGWLRYVVANHHQQDRWQLMDFERFALVNAAGVPATAPLPAAVGGPAANDPLQYSVYDASCSDDLFFSGNQYHCWNPAGVVPNRGNVVGTNSHPALNGQGGVFWDTRWGSCITATGEANPGPACGKGVPTATTRQMDIAAGETKGIEVNSLAEPSEQLLALDAVRDVPVLRDNPGRYYVVSWVNPYGAIAESDTTNDIACTAVDIAAINPAANAGKEISVTRSASQPATCPWQQGAPTSVAAVTAPKGITVVKTKSDRALPRMKTAKAKTYAKSAIRKALKLKRTPKGLKLSCKVTSAARSTCAASWKNGRTAYKGTVKLSYSLNKSKGRWRYSVDMTKKRPGHKTVKIKKATTTGGSIKLA
jgi:hypothetical protein